MIGPLGQFTPYVPSYEGLDFIIRGKMRKTCFGDNKNRPGIKQYIHDRKLMEAGIIEKPKERQHVLKVSA